MSGGQHVARGELAPSGLGRRSFVGRALLAGVGAAIPLSLHSRLELDAAADSTTDVQMLQTAASIENVALMVYTRAEALFAPVTGAVNPVLAQFAKTSLQQHGDHARAFNGAIAALGGKNQPGADGKFLQGTVAPALALATTPGDLVGVMERVEDVASQTAVKFAQVAVSPQVIVPLASAAAVAAQRHAFVTVIKLLLDGGTPLASITLPLADLGALPDAAGAAGFPRSFHPTREARPSDEGAVA